jgi:hypothetical protein
MYGTDLDYKTRLNAVAALHHRHGRWKRGAAWLLGTALGVPAVLGWLTGLVAHAVPTP